MTAKATITVKLGRSRTPRTVAAAPVPRLARLLAFAHKLDAEIRSGVYEDQADAARKLGLTRARVTQVMNLSLLSPTIQHAILLAFSSHMAERDLRVISARAAWGRQVADFHSYCAHLVYRDPQLGGERDDRRRQQA